MEFVIASVVDPKTLILDPDPGFWLNLNTDPGLYYKFRTKKIILEIQYTLS